MDQLSGIHGAKHAVFYGVIFTQLIDDSMSMIVCTTLLNLIYQVYMTHFQEIWPFTST
jgi:hypothetical protein